MSGNFTFMKGNIDIIILCALFDADKYGYEIAKEIKEKTSNRYEIKQPTLYSYLKRLEDDGLIVSYWGESSNGGRRRYYTITAEGRKDCEAFVAEWKYQRTIMSDLVDDTATDKSISQKEATPLFGRKATSRRSRKSEMQNALNEQDEIARRLKELTGEDDDTNETGDKTVEAENEVKTPAFERITTIVEEEEIATDEETTATIIADTAPIEPPKQEVYNGLTEEERKKRFKVNQDNADDFIQGFENLAKEASTRQPGDDLSSEGENYQHILMGVIGDQLDDIKELNDERATPYYTNHPAALEEVADDLAKEGIRIRIYNHATATYKSKQLMPLAKVLCQTAWLSYLLPVAYFVILALCSIDISNWLPSVIAVAVMALIPIGFTVYAIMDPTRKDKPPFNFGKILLAAVLLSLIVILLAVGISTLNKIEFSNFVDVTNKILIPTGIILYAPLFVIIYNQLYRKY